MNYERWDSTIAAFETFLISQLSRIATWIAPLVPAMFVFSSAQTHIDNVGLKSALIIAAVVELLGISVVSNWLDVKEYNRLFPDEEIDPPTSMFTIYVLTLLCIIFGLKIAPVTFGWLALVSLSMMGVWSALAYVQRRQHHARMSDKKRDMSRTDEDKELDRELDKELRLARHRQQLAQIEAETVKSKDPVSSRDDMDKRTLTKDERLDKLLTELEKLSVPDDINIDTLSNTFSVSSRTIRRDIDELSKAGKLSLNGHVKILG